MQTDTIQICSPRSGDCSEASHIIGTLFQGNRPHIGADLTDFDLLVLCAQEWQPRARDCAFIGVPEVYHCPLDDAGWRPLEPGEIKAITDCATVVATYLQSNKRVLTTCAMGWNRSGVISAMAMRIAYGFSAARAIMMVRLARGEHALSNASFVKLIEEYRC